MSIPDPLSLPNHLSHTLFSIMYLLSKCMIDKSVYALHTTIFLAVLIELFYYHSPRFDLKKPYLPVMIHIF